MEIQHETTTHYCFITYQGKLLTWANSKIVQNTFDSCKCQLLYNKMSKVKNSYKLTLKTILTWTDCKREYICIYANICTRMQICQCECTIRVSYLQFSYILSIFLKVELYAKRSKNHFTLHLEPTIEPVFSKYDFRRKYIQAPVSAAYLLLVLEFRTI